VTRLEIIGWGLVSSAGTGSEELVGALLAVPPPVEVAGMYDEPLPTPRAYALVDFNVRAELGRKGTGFFDRRTALTVVGCRRALEDAGLQVNDGNRRRIGVVLGTTAGSIKSSVDYAIESFTQNPPYMVNPALFPNTVMNCAAGQSAIWFGLNGINATVAGGRMAFLSVLRYCANAFRGRQADFLLAGAVEEFTPHAAWLSWLRRPGARATPGEGGAVFVLRPTAGGVANTHRPDGEVRSVVLGFCPDGRDRVAAIAGCIRRALWQAGMGADDVRTAAIGGADGPQTEATSSRAISEALEGTRWQRLAVDDVAGDNQTATGALELAALLALHRHDPRLDGQGSLLVAQNAEGAIGAAVVRGWSRAAHRR
jgi:3-oxoacyl-[acyl-carrier-protein] synthase II